jgi:four helix bundle protein
VRDLVKEVYMVSLRLPAEEKFNMVQQIRRAALSVKLNLAEGASRKSALERARYLEIARGTVVEIDAVLETAVDLQYFSVEDLNAVGALLKRNFAMLSRMINP